MSPSAGPPSVSDVLELEAVRRGRPRVVAGRSGLRAPVRWTHVLEVPDIAHLLRGGELLLTTGIALPEDDAGLRTVVGELADVAAAGLVVELGRRFDGHLPPALVAAAEQRGLPLVELHRETPFVRVTEAVHALVLDAQVAQLRLSDQVHRTFTELSVEGAAPSEVVRQTARMAGRPVVLENLAHQVLVFDPAGMSTEELLDRWEARSRSVQVPGRTGYDQRTGWLVSVVGARGTDWGRLVLVGDLPPTDRDLMLIERSAGTLALNRLVERDREGLERQTHRTLLAALLQHDVVTSEAVLRAQALGVPLEGRALVALVLRHRRVDADPLPAAPIAVQARVRELADDAAAAVRGARLTALVGVVDATSVGVLVSLPDPETVDRRIEQYVVAVHQRVSERPGPVALVAAAGSTVDAPRDIRRAFLEAGQVADAALQQPPRSIYRLPDVRLRGLVHLLRDDARLQTFVERELGPLLAHDDRDGPPLLPALRAYLAAGRNKSAAAEAAHLSRPTFYERLHQLEEVLQADLDDVEVCLSLHVALVALDAVRG